MKVISKIKMLLKTETIKNLAAVCDTRRLSSNIEKMKLAMKVMLEDRKDVIQIGGATNRIVVQLEGYIIKIAVDSQGYEDNLMEFSICEELYPDVTKSFETNGYILVAQTVRLPTKEEWRQRKAEVLRILDRLSKDYLLGDVGYDDLNRTNWGITDDNRMVILDYAYVHRATEKLFTCPECGDGILTYDQNYTVLMCANTVQCHARYTYSEMKRIQGDQVDQETIAERLAAAIVMPGDVFEQETILTHGSTLVGDEDVVVIHNNLEYERFMEEENGERPIGATSVPLSVLEKHDPYLFNRLLREYGPAEAGVRYRKAIGLEDVEEPKERPKRKWILADDYFEYSSRPISAKPIDREYGETQEEYEERKKEEIKEEVHMKDFSKRLIDMPHAQAYFNGGTAYEQAEPIARPSNNQDEDDQYVEETYMGLKPMIFPRPDDGKGVRKKVPALGETFDDEGNVWFGRHRVERGGPVFLGRRSSLNEKKAIRNDNDNQRKSRSITTEYIEASARFAEETTKLKSIANNGDTREEREKAAIAYREMINAGVEQFMEVRGGGTPEDQQKPAQHQNVQSQPKQSDNNRQQYDNRQKKKKNGPDGNQHRGKLDKKTIVATMTPGGTTAQMYEQELYEDNSVGGEPEVTNCVGSRQVAEKPTSDPAPKPQSRPQQTTTNSDRLTGTIGSMVTMPVIDEEPEKDTASVSTDTGYPQHVTPTIRRPETTHSDSEPVADDSEEDPVDSVEEYDDDAAEEPSNGSFNAQYQKRPVLGSTSREPEENGVEPISLMIDGQEVSISDSQ